jgi:hypothetical protein
MMFDDLPTSDDCYFATKRRRGENYDDDCFAIIMARYTSKFPVSRFIPKANIHPRPADF